MLSGLTFIARGRKILRSVVICVCGVGFGVDAGEAHRPFATQGKRECRCYRGNLVPSG
jgi:hypothetical protein